MKLDDGYIYVRADKKEEAVIKTWRQMTYDRAHGYWVGRISLSLLENLMRNGGLTPAAKNELKRLQRIRGAVDDERIRPADDVKPMVKYPVNAKLYAHQVRAANMALMVFEMIKPPGEEVGV